MHVIKVYACVELHKELVVSPKCISETSPNFPLVTSRRGGDTFSLRKASEVQSLSVSYTWENIHLRLLCGL